VLQTRFNANLTFAGPCIVKQGDQNVSVNLIITIQTSGAQRLCNHSVYFYSKTNKMHNISNFFYFGTMLDISDGLSVHHQKSKTVHTASGICHTGSVAAS
jgi:hypothetical protein